MKTLTRLGLGLATIALPLAVMAAAPSGVRGITATNEGGNVRVMWQQGGSDVASYRIYYSHQSILQNGGQYDDFEAVDGSVNAHLLQNVPPVRELFVSVLAVNNLGEESLFMEEMRVTLDGAPATSAATSSVARPSSVAARGELRLLEVVAMSATGVMLRFSHPVAVPQERAMEAVMIDAGSGQTLQITRLVIVDNTITLHTAVQERGKTYIARVSSVITGRDQNGQMVQLSADQSPMLFAGHMMGSEPTVSQPGTPAGSFDVSNLRIRAQEQSNGRFTVEVSWQPPSTPIGGYVVSQSFNNGATYGEPSTISPQTLGTRITDVPAGDFGILVKVLSPNGALSQGISQVIKLTPAQASSQPPVQGSVTPLPTGGSTNLPNSGPALWLSIFAALSLAGYQTHRRLQKIHA